MSESFLSKIQKGFTGTVMANLKISINSKNINNIKEKSNNDIYKVVAKDNFLEEILEILLFIIIIIL